MSRSALSEEIVTMKFELAPKRETLLEAGYKYVRFLGNRCHLMQDLVTGNLEVWASTRQASHNAIMMGNIALEFMKQWEGQR